MWSHAAPATLNATLVRPPPSRSGEPEGRAPAPVVPVADPARAAVAPATPGGMTGRVLVVECDGDARGTVDEGLQRAGMTVERVADVRHALQRVRAGLFAVVILDIDGPDGDGFERCRSIRRGCDVPLVLLSARDSEADRVRGLEAGADDYLGKPVAIAELVSRVRALLRRRRLDLGPHAPALRAGDIEIDVVGLRVTVAGRSVALTPTEFRLLEYVAREPDRQFSAREILSLLWHGEDG